MTSASDWSRTSATPYSVMYTSTGKPGQTTEARTWLPFQQLCRPNHPFQQQSCYSARRGEGRASSSIPTGRSCSVPKRPLRPLSRNPALPPECRLSVVLRTFESLMTVTALRPLIAAAVAIGPIACPTSPRRRSCVSLWPPPLLATFPVPARLPDTSWQPSDSSPEPPGRCRAPSRAAIQHPLWRRNR